jgi:hypothetical protein
MDVVLTYEYASREVLIVLATPAYAQRLLIDELKAAIGVPNWGCPACGPGDITNNVLHYEVSEYVLGAWTPVLRTHGVLVMARNDLGASRPMPAARMSFPRVSRCGGRHVRSVGG